MHKAYIFILLFYAIIIFLQNKMKVTYKLQTKKPSPSQQKPSQWQSLIKTLVRPPRMCYNQSQIGYKHFKIKNRQFTRIDQTILHNGKKLYLSTFVPDIRNYKLILYLHGNSSCKLQCKSLLQYLPKGFSLASFDFLGCGNNMEQDYITLGYSQSQQVQTIVNYLQSQNYKVYLWGRSMGAVSALKYGKTDIIVADSPFRSMKKLCKQLSTSKLNPLPNCIVNCLFPCVFLKLRSDIKKKGNYDLNQLDIQKSVSNISQMTTLIFLCGKDDDLIEWHNSQKLFHKFLGFKKYIQIVQGNHNSKRPAEIMYKIMQIIQKNSDQHQPICSSLKIEKIQLKF